MSKFRLIFVVLFALFFASSAYAADIRLSSRCTLADAIIAANRDRAEGGCRAGRGADTITLTRDITLDGGLPKITSAITIEGGGYTISGDNHYRIFFNDGGALTIKDLIMTKGRVEGDFITNEDSTLKATTANPIGGAIVNWKGTLTISDSSFSDNSAEYGGAIVSGGKLSISSSSFSNNSTNTGGGAILNVGELNISDSNFSDNSADTDGGAILNVGELSISDSSFSDNSGRKGGGAIYNRWEGTLTISDSTFSRNSGGYGGAIYNVGESSIRDSAFSNNSANGDASINWESSISDSTFSRYSGGSGGAIYNYAGTLTIRSSAFSDNLTRYGGAILNNEGTLTISDSSFSRNSAEYGGAIRNWEGTLSIANSTISDNLANRGAGAIDNDGELSISDSSFSRNSADDAGGAIGNGTDGELSMVNSAFSGNSANWGGAIYNWGALSISSSTFSGNSADEYVGAIYNDEGTLSITNSIIAGNGSACYSSNSLRLNIRNFIQDGSCSPALRGDPKLGALVVPEDGSPAYFPLLAGSRAIDAVDDAYCPETDQIGTKRPQGAGCDIGAIEYVAP